MLHVEGFSEDTWVTEEVATSFDMKQIVDSKTQTNGPEGQTNLKPGQFNSKVRTSTSRKRPHGDDNPNTGPDTKRKKTLEELGLKPSRSSKSSAKVAHRSKTLTERQQRSAAGQEKLIQYAFIAYLFFKIVT